MVNGELNFRLHPGDLALQRGDARFEFRHRERIEVLPDDRIQRIVGANAGFIAIHGRNR